MSQFPPHRISVTDDLRSGNAVSADLTKKGTPVAGAEAQNVILVSLGIPAASDADGAAASQDVTAAGPGFVLNGALVVDGVAVFDVPRNVVAAWTGAAVITITGTDAYGATVVEASASGTSHAGAKAFKRITAITTSADITSATVGTGDVLGLPYRTAPGALVVASKRVVATLVSSADAATVVLSIDGTATATTGDVRGTLNPAVAIAGDHEIFAQYAVQNGPANEDGFGVAQFAG